jgi:glycosyltransferase involved in cell wall biosynthesis
MDFNPDEAIAAGWLQADSTPARILESMSRFSLRQAHGIVALDRFMRDRIAAKGIASEKITVIPPWSHDDVVCFDSASRERFRNRHGLEGKFVVMYSGNHSPVHPLDTLLEAAEKLRGHPDIVFCFVGGGSAFERVQQWAKDGKGNALCLPYQPLDQLAASLSAADLHVVVMGDPFVGLVHPCKIYNILRVGSALLYVGPEPSHVSEILRQFNGQLLAGRARHGDVSQVVQNILGLKESGVRPSREKCLPLAAQFSKETLLPRLVKVLESAAVN